MVKLVIKYVVRGFKGHVRGLAPKIAKTSDALSRNDKILHLEIESLPSYIMYSESDG